MRKCRFLVNGARYHVTARINRGEFALEGPVFKELFLDTLQRAKSKYSFNITNFCIMNNHIHMIIEPLAEESLSRIMQWILSVFAMSFNRIMNYKGHVWYDRFHSTIIDDIKQLLATFEYITLNPVRADIVKHPFLFKFNGVNFILYKDYSIIEPPLNLFKPFIQELIRKAA